MRVVLAIVLLILLPGAASARDYNFCFGGGGGMVKLSGSDFFKFDWEKSYNFTIGKSLSSRWSLMADYSFYTLANDDTADSTASLETLNNNTALDFEATRLGLKASRLLFDPDNTLNLSTGLGVGVLMWKKIDPATGESFWVTGGGGEPKEFKASELFVTGSAGLVFAPVPRLALNVDVQADYLTHAGAEFDPDVKSSLNRWQLGVGATLTFRFGGKGKPATWRSDTLWTEQQSTPVGRRLSARDSDGDGVDDEYDRCQNSSLGIRVDRYGCAVDSDGDGVPDGLDDCPGSDREARGTVDMFGCPVDSDFDGIADYMDSCAFNAEGAMVDNNGCPIDSDNDGIADGLDDCPNTLYGMEVDKYGCIDLSMFSKPMVLHITYPSGSFEIDPNSKERIKRLAGVLNFVPEIKLEIHGFSDNIGTTAANRQISEKRANRVRSFLVTQGIATDRMKVFGRGEENYIASNATAEGRAKNRRIEIIFYK